MSYAEGTSVPIERSQGEIRQILSKYNASGFQFGEKKDVALVAFEMQSRMVRFILPLATEGHKTKKNVTMSMNQLAGENRRRWRCLVLAIKSKLECVESGITTFENEFMAHIVLPNGDTVGKVMQPQIDSAYKSGKMPPLLGYTS